MSLVRYTDDKAVVASFDWLQCLMDNLHNIKRGKVSVRTPVTVGVASSAANDVTMRMTS